MARKTYYEHASGFSAWHFLFEANPSEKWTGRAYRVSGIKKTAEDIPAVQNSLENLTRSVSCARVLREISRVLQFV